MSNKASALIIAEITEKLLNQIDEVERQKAEMQNFVNTLVPGLKNGSITVDRLQVLENGDIRILPPAPNGVAELEVETVPLAEVKEGVGVANEND